MKKFAIMLLVMTIGANVYSQTSSVKTKEGLAHAGIMNQDIRLRFTAEEEKLYLQCLDAAGLCDEESIWMNDDIFKEIINDYESFSRIIINGRINKGVYSKEEITGLQERCIQPRCLIFVEREYDDTHMKLQVYY